MTRSTLISLSAFVLLALTGCQSSDVGDPCIPQAIPAGGFAPQDIVIETTSVMCRTRVCLVYEFAGDPTHEFISLDEHTCELDGFDEDGVALNPDGSQWYLDDLLCRSRHDIREHVYCSCRCDTGVADSNVPLCDCPNGFACVELQEGGGPGVEGSYCVRSAVTRDGGG